MWLLELEKGPDSMYSSLLFGYETGQPLYGNRAAEKPTGFHDRLLRTEMFHYFSKHYFQPR
jgi:hypothetical protein